MAVTEKYSIGAVNLNDTVDVLIKAITESTLDLGPELRREPTSGEVYPRFISLGAGNPVASFGTYGIVTGLDNIGLTGLDIAGLATGLELYCYKHTEGGTRYATSVHRTFTAAAGIVVPQSLSVDHQGDCVLRYQATPTSSDGTTHPLAINDVVALPMLADDERFTLGPVTIGAISIGQMQSLNIDFQVAVVPEGADSNPYPTFVSIETIQPSFTFRVSKQTALAVAAIPLDGKAATHANTTIYLRKRAAGGTFVADGTAEHVKLTAAGLAVVTSALGDSVEIRLDCNYDGTNAPIVVDTTSAIT